jgi:hypothetical protein
MTEINLHVDGPETYQGWTNQETWLVNLWLTNVLPTERKLRQISGKLSHRQDRAQVLAAYVSAQVPLPRYASGDNASLYTDLLQGALDKVNWAEIIENHEHDNDQEEYEEDEE